MSLVTYNHERYVEQALEGILMQETNFDFDIVVGDDFSTDGTRSIIRDYERRFPGKMTTVLPDHNLGDAGRLMFVETIKLCRGRYIAMLDGDDYWTAPDKLQRQADFLDAHPECSLCYHDAIFVSDDLPIPTCPFIPTGHPEFATTEDLLWSCFIPGCSAMLRREILDEFPEWFFNGPWADIPLYLMASERGKLGLINEIMGAYRVHAGGAWSSLDNASQIKSTIAVLGGLSDEIKTKHHSVISRSKCVQHLHLAKYLIERRFIAQSLRHVVEAIICISKIRKRDYLTLTKTLLSRSRKI